MPKHVTRFILGGTLYMMIELIWRTVVNHRSPSIIMFFIAGLVNTTILLCDDKKLNIFFSALIGALLTTLLELIVGIISVNYFDTYLWMYSGITYRGIISLKWSLLWYALCFIVIFVYRKIRKLVD